MAVSCTFTMKKKARNTTLKNVCWLKLRKGLRSLTNYATCLFSTMLILKCTLISTLIRNSKATMHCAKQWVTFLEWALHLKQNLKLLPALVALIKHVIDLKFPIRATAIKDCCRTFFPAIFLR